MNVPTGQCCPPSIGMVAAFKLESLAGIVGIRILIGHVRAEPMPLPKSGQCPSGYRESGGYCAPMNDKAPIAMPKVGQCPSGWASAAHYCVEMRRR